MKYFLVMPAREYSSQLSLIASLIKVFIKLLSAEGLKDCFEGQICDELFILHLSL